eukprot:jgi/Tetstr1/459853/TSEL_005202.t1
MPPRPVPEDALVDDAPGGATAASIAELEKRLTAQAEALEKRLAEQFEAATAALLARLAPPVHSPPPKGTQPAIPAGAPAPEGGEQGAQEPLPAELDALATELEYVDFAYFGQVPPSGLDPTPSDGDEPRLWILTDDTELEKRLTAQAIAQEKRLAEQFEAATAALLARLAPPVHSPPPKGTQPAIPAGAPAPEGGEQGAQEPLPAELDALATELEYVDFAYFGQVPPSGLDPTPSDGDEPRLWILTDDTELEKRLTAQAIAQEKRLAEQFEAATAALLARLAPPVQPPPPKGTQTAIPAGVPAPEGGEQGAQEPLPAELDALDTELEYVDFAYFGQVPPSGLEPAPPRDGDEPRLWILTDDTAAHGLAESGV